MKGDSAEKEIRDVWTSYTPTHLRGQMLVSTFLSILISRVLCHSSFGDVSLLGYEYWRKRVVRCPMKRL